MKPKLQLVEPEICPRCGNAFHCGKSGKCWCYEIQTSTSLLEAINKAYDSCLCPSCLEEINTQGKI